MNFSVLLVTCLACAFTVTIATQETSLKHNRARRYTDDEAKLILKALALLEASDNKAPSKRDPGQTPGDFDKREHSDDTPLKRDPDQPPPFPDFGKRDHSDDAKSYQQPPQIPDGWTKRDHNDAAKYQQPPHTPDGWTKRDHDGTVSSDSNKVVNEDESKMGSDLDDMDPIYSGPRYEEDRGSAVNSFADENGDDDTIVPYKRGGKRPSNSKDPNARPPPPPPPPFPLKRGSASKADSKAKAATYRLPSWPYKREHWYPDLPSNPYKKAESPRQAPPPFPGKREDVRSGGDDPNEIRDSANEGTGKASWNRLKRLLDALNNAIE